MKIHDVRLKFVWKTQFVIFHKFLVMVWKTFCSKSFLLVFCSIGCFQKDLERTCIREMKIVVTSHVSRKEKSLKIKSSRLVELKFRNFRAAKLIVNKISRQWETQIICKKRQELIFQIRWDVTTKKKKMKSG